MHYQYNIRLHVGAWRAMPLQLINGEEPEWLNGPVSKTVVPKGTQGSNPCLSAIKRSYELSALSYQLKSIKKSVKLKVGLLKL